MRPDSLLRRWRYINHLLTYFIFTCTYLQPVVAVVCSSFDLQSSAGCGSDFVELSRSQNFSASQRLGRYCGNQLPPRTIVPSSIWIKFRSDANNITGTGFVANYMSCQSHFHLVVVVIVAAAAVVVVVLVVVVVVVVRASDL